MLLSILKDRNNILEKIEKKKEELLKLEKERMLFANNLTHQINTLQLVGRSFYFYDTQTDNNFVIKNKFNKDSFRDKDGYFDLDYFDVLKGKELQEYYPQNKFIFIKQENLDNDNFEKLSGIKFKEDNTYLLLVKYDLTNMSRKCVEEIPLKERKILQYIMVQLD